MDLKQLILKNRSYRRFYQNVEIKKDLLIEWVNLARLSNSAKNMQPLKYYISNKEDTNKAIFETLKWAGYLNNWNGPDEGERPSAYIIIYLDKNITSNNYCDHTIAAHSILLGAVNDSFGGCIIAAFNKNKIKKITQQADNLDPLLVLALGKPKEKIQLYDVDDNADIKYWRNKEKIHFVPKRKLKNIIL